MSPQQILRIFWSRWQIVAVVFSAVFLSAFTASMLLSPQYSATTQLYVNLADPNNATNSQVPGAVIRNYIATQVEAVRSRGTALVVVQQEKLAADPKWQAAYRDAGVNGVSIEDWISQVLLQRLVVARMATSDIIAVTYQSGTAEGAAGMANAFAAAYLRKEMDLRTAPAHDLAGWYDDRLKSLRERYATVEAGRSQLRLEAIRRGEVDATGAPDTPNSLPATIAGARAAVIQAKAALDIAKNGQNPSSENMELLQLRRQRSEIDLTLRREAPLLGAEHRRVQMLRANLQQTDAQIAQSLARLRAEIVAEKERELATAEARLTDAVALMGRDETQRHDQIQNRAAATALDRELESLRSQIDALVQRRERSGQESTATIGNVSVLSRAAVPQSPSWPRIPLILAIATALGLVLGFVLAFLREMYDRRVRCVDDLTSYFPIPMLGTLTSALSPNAMRPLPPAPQRLMGGIRRPQLQLAKEAAE